MMSTPCSRRRSASCLTAMVALGFTVASLLESAGISFLLPVRETLRDGPGDRFRDETGDVSAERRDLFDEPRAEIGVGLRRHHEDGLHPGVEPAVHQRH